MSPVDKYRRRAIEADHLARLAHTPEEREAYTRIAEGWRDLENSAMHGGSADCPSRHRKSST